MGNLWRSGAELQSATAGMEFETVTGAGVSIDTTHANHSPACLKTAPTATTALIRHTFQADTVNTHFEKFDFLPATLPAATIKMWEYVDSGNGVGFSLNITSAGVLQMVNDTLGVTVLASSGALSTTVYSVIQIKIIDSASTTATFELKVNGTTVSTSTGLTGVNGGGRIVLGAITGTSSPVFYFDNIAINDTSGSSETGYPDQNERIVHLYPALAGDNAIFTPLSSTNVSNVDETPTPDDVTSYNSINSAATAGTQIDDFKVGSPSTAGIGASDTIKLVAVGIRGGSTATTTGATLNPRIKSAASATTTTAAVADAYNVNGWRTNGATPFQYGLTSYLDPTTSAAWTRDGTNSLSNMQIGYTNAASNTTVRRVSSVWALVAYVAAAGNPKMETFSDPFNQTSLNATAWFQTAAGSATMSYDATGATTTFPASSTASTEGDVFNNNVYDLTASHAFVHVITIPATGTHADGYLSLLTTGGTGNGYRWVVEAGTLYAQHLESFASTTVVSFTYSSTTHAYWSIREGAGNGLSGSTGTVYWDTSPDGVTWTNQGSNAIVTAVTALAPLIGGACYQAETSPGTFKFNNYNTAASTPTNLFFY